MRSLSIWRKIGKLFMKFAVHRWLTFTINFSKNSTKQRNWKVFLDTSVCYAHISTVKLWIWCSFKSTSPRKNHEVLYKRAIYRISQISNCYAWSASFWCLKPENIIKSFNMACVAMRSRVLSNSHFLAKFAKLHRSQTPYF